MEKLSVQPYKGTRDFYPRDMKLRSWFFGKIRKAPMIGYMCAFEARYLRSYPHMISNLDICRLINSSTIHIKNAVRIACLEMNIT